jgi:hypothetical protein
MGCIGVKKKKRQKKEEANLNTTGIYRCRALIAFGLWYTKSKYNNSNKYNCKYD